VEAHGGRIRAESAGTGRGATFTVELPKASPSAMDDAESHGDGIFGGAARSAPETPMRLLLVEDHEPTMSVLTRLLARAGHQPVAARNLAEARAAAAQQPFDLVISDLGLPDGSGVDLMQELHDRYGLRGIALSGYGTDEDMRRTEAAGFVTHLVKPVDFKDLRLALRGLVKQEA